MISPSSPAARGLVGRGRAEPRDPDHLVDAGAAGRARLCRRVLVDGEGVDFGRAVMIDEQLRLERRRQLLEQAVGHRRAGKAELAHRREVGRREPLMAHEVVVERRHQVEVADLLGGDQLERARGLEARQAHEGAADQRHGEQRAHPHGVIERHDAERALAVAVEILRDMGERGGALGALAARHALRPRGGARRIEHDRPGFGVGPRPRILGAAAEQGFEGELIRLRPPERDPCQLPRRLGRMHRRRGGVLVHDRHRHGIVEAEIELVGARAPIERRDDDAGELARPVDGRRLPAVLQHGDQMIARRRARARRSRSPAPRCADTTPDR